MKEKLIEFIKENNLNVVEMDGKLYVTDFRKYKIVVKFIEEVIGMDGYDKRGVSIVRNNHRKSIKVKELNDWYKDYWICEMSSDNGLFGWYLGFDVTDIIKGE